MAQVSLKKNIALSTFYQVLKIVMPFITAPYISRVLGPSNVGIYSYTYSINTYFTLFAALGTVTYGTREIARVRNDKAKLSRLFFEIELLSVLTTTACLVAWGIFAVLNTTYRGYYFALTFNLLAVMFDVSWFYAGIEQFQYTVGWNSLLRILSVIAMFMFVKSPDDLWMYIFIVAFQNFAGNVGMWMGLRKFIHKVDFRQLHIGHHFHETLVYFIPTIATSIYNVLDKTLIGVITRSTAENGYYEQANKILDMTKAVTFVALNSVMRSRISYMFANEQYEEIKERIKLSTNYVTFMGFGICFGLMGIADTFVPWFFGSGYERTITLLKIMSPVVVIIGLSNCLGSQYYTPSGRRKESAKYIIMGSVINFCLNMLMIPYLKSYGAAIATVIAELAITIAYIAHSQGYMNFKTVAAIAWRKLVAGIVMLAVVLLVAKLPVITILKIILEVGLGFSVYCMMLFVLGDAFIRVATNFVLRHIPGLKGFQI